MDITEFSYQQIPTKIIKNNNNIGCNCEYKNTCYSFFVKIVILLN